MIHPTNIETLIIAFRSRPKCERRRLLTHAERGTPIACGKNASRYLTVDGAG